MLIGIAGSYFEPSLSKRDLSIEGEEISISNYIASQIEEEQRRSVLQSYFVFGFASFV